MKKIFGFIKYMHVGFKVENMKFSLECKRF